MSLSRFQGALVGGLVGDCIGSRFEGDTVVKMSKVKAHCDEIKKNYQKGKEKGNLPYTDDTAMARIIVESLKEHGTFNAEDMAKKFAEEFFSEPHRGYGGNVRNVFSALLEPGLKDFFKPASEQFDGSGSYGNGGAMRIHPAPLFAFNQDSSSLRELVTQITRLTHTHHLAIDGAILQAFAVNASLRLSSEEDLDCDKFCDDLISIMKQKESADMSDGPSAPKKTPPKRPLDTDPMPYCAKLEKIKEFVKAEGLKAITVESVLGNDVSALGSVPAAILAFLRGPTIKKIEDENPFKRVIMYAISLGGDTDTIACMAGAMAGALYGMEAIPEEWCHCCEGVEDALEAGIFLHANQATDKV